MAKRPKFIVVRGNSVSGEEYYNDTLTGTATWVKRIEDAKRMSVREAKDVVEWYKETVKWPVRMEEWYE